MRRKIALGEGETERVSCVSASAFRGVDTACGEVLSGPVLVERVGWLTGLVGAMSGAVIADHWRRADIA